MVILLIGETGAGKSSLLYNLAIHAARNKALWGVPLGLRRPLRVLYVDPENAGSWEEGRGGVCALRLDRIGEDRPENLLFHDGRSLNLSNPLHMAALGELLRGERIDLCILDPIANLFGTEDENDNAEAAQQMKALAALSRETGACVIACHHTGKDSTGNYGRGASARLASADIGMVFRARGSSEEVDDDFCGATRQRDDACRLQIVKNRVEGWARRDQAREEIWLFLADGKEHSRGEVIEAMKREGIGGKVERPTRRIRSLKLHSRHNHLSQCHR